MPVKFAIKRTKNFFIHRVLHVEDTPHRIALGVAVGMFVTWTPTMGFQMAFIVLLSMLLRANKFVGVPFAWLSNPFTMLPIYGPSYIVGCWLLGDEYSFNLFTEAVRKAFVINGGWFRTVQTWWEATWPIFLPLWLGSIVTGFLVALLSYFAVYHAVILYRRHKQQAIGNYEPRA